MTRVSEEGRTVLLVSHNMAAITRLCKWGIRLDGGQLREFGSAEDVVAKYLALESQGCGEVVFPSEINRAPGTEYIRLQTIRIRTENGRIATSLDARSPFTIEIGYRILRPVSNLRVGFRLMAHDGTVVLSSTDADSTADEVKRQPGTYVSRSTIPGNFLNYGPYFLSVGSDTPMIQSHFLIDQGLAFRVEHTGGVGWESVRHPARNRARRASMGDPEARMRAR